MSPRTRQSQAGGSKDHAHAEINEIEVPLQTPSTSKRRSNPNAADINVPLPGKSKIMRGEACNSLSQVCEKRTFSSSDASTSMPSETQAKAAKKSRTDGMCFTNESQGGTDREGYKGPAHGRPMSLKIAHESQIVNQQESDGNTIKGKRVQLQRGEGKAY